MILIIKEIKDACGTYALLAVLLNNNYIEIGEDLENFKNFTKELDCTMKGLALSNNENIKNVKIKLLILKVHNSFSRPEPIFI